MKRAKLLISVILVLALALALSVSAFAVGGTIRILNPAEGETYKAYKIFDAEWDDTTDPANPKYVYTLAADSGWKSVLMNDDGTSKIPGLTFTPDDPASPTLYTVTKGASFSSAGFAATLQAAESGKTPNASTTYEAATADSDKLDVAYNGYYLITSTKGAKAALTTVYAEGTAKDSVAVQDKNDMPFDKDVSSSATGTPSIDNGGVKVGDTLHFTIKGKVPVINNSQEYAIYYVFDDMSAGLDFDETTGLTVTIDGTQVALSAASPTDKDKYLLSDEYRYDYNNHTWELGLDMLTYGKDAALQGKDIVITYQATVTEEAIGRVINNEAELQYTDSNGDLVIKNDETRNYVVEVIVNKYETGAPLQKLAGAKFTLQDKDSNYLQADGTWDTAVYEFVTNDEGRIAFQGLEDGTYTLTETAAPNGYVMLADPITITVNGKAALDPSIYDDEATQAVYLIQTVDVANTPGSVLPSTGGRGATMLYVAGLVLIMAAGAFLVLRKRNVAA